MLKVKISRKKKAKNPSVHRIVKAGAAVLRDPEVVGAKIARALSGVPDHRLVTVELETAFSGFDGQPANRVEVEQINAICGQTILQGHVVSAKLQREFSEAIQKGFKSKQPLDSFSFGGSRPPRVYTSRRNRLDVRPSPSMRSNQPSI